MEFNLHLETVRCAARTVSPAFEKNQPVAYFLPEAAVGITADKD